MREFLKFCLVLGLFSLAVHAFFYFLVPGMPINLRYLSWWKLQLLFIVVTLIFHYLLLRSSGKRNNSITVIYMAGTTFKLLLFAGIIIAYTLKNQGSAKGFIVAFFLMYIFYTVFEVGVLYKKFSSKTPVKTSPDESGK